MKIVFLISKLDYSGGPKMLAWLANQFSLNNCEVHFISAYDSENVKYSFIV